MKKQIKIIDIAQDEKYWEIEDSMLYLSKHSGMGNYRVSCDTCTNTECKNCKLMQTPITFKCSIEIDELADIISKKYNIDKDEAMEIVLQSEKTDYELIWPNIDDVKNVNMNLYDDIVGIRAKTFKLINSLIKYCSSYSELIDAVMDTLEIPKNKIYKTREYRELQKYWIYTNSKFNMNYYK